MAIRISPEDYFNQPKPVEVARQPVAVSMQEPAYYYDNTQQLMMFYTFMALVFIIVLIIALAYLKRRD